MATKQPDDESTQGQEPEEPKESDGAKKAAPKKKAEKAAEPQHKEEAADPEDKAAPAEDAPAEDAPKKREPKERHFVDAKTGKTIEKPKQGGTGEATKALRDEMHAERKGNALPFRIAAIVLWVLGIACEVVCILTANGTLYLPGLSLTTWIIIWLVADAVLVIAGSQLWKHANHISPASKENKLAYWAQTDLGIIIAVIAFAPVILLMLTNKNLDKKTKQVCSAVAAVALVAAVASGVDYHPTSQEDLDQAQAGAAVLSDDGLCYWTPFGKKYHFNPDCQYLKNSGTIYSGTIQDAMDAGRNEGCSGCTVEGGTDLLANADPDAVASVLQNVISVSDDATQEKDEALADAESASSSNGTGQGQEELPQAA